MCVCACVSRAATSVPHPGPSAFRSKAAPYACFASLAPPSPPCTAGAAPAGVRESPSSINHSFAGIIRSRFRGYNLSADHPSVHPLYWKEQGKSTKRKHSEQKKPTHSCHFARNHLNLQLLGGFSPPGGQPIHPAFAITAPRGPDGRGAGKGLRVPHPAGLCPRPYPAPSARLPSTRRPFPTTDPMMGHHPSTPPP